jgi:hypothetical protein
MTTIIPTALATWLQSPEADPGVLITYPPGYNVSNIVAAVLSPMLNALAGKTVLLMVQNPAEVNQALGLELPQELYIPYGESPLLERAIVNEAWIIVDSPQIFRTLRVGEMARNKSPASRFLVFGSLGVDQIDLEYLNQSLPGIWSLYTSFVDRRLRLEFHLEVTSMTEEQNRHYRQRRAEEDQHLISGTSSQKHEARLRLHTKQIGNFVYPYDIQQVIDLPRTRNVEAALDMVMPAGWITGQVIDDIVFRSPKLQRELTIILGRREERHVVYTRFKNRYGVYLITALLTLLGIPTIAITGDDKKIDQRLAKINQFNQMPSGVLITNLVLPGDVVSVTNIHFTEGFEANIYQGLMQRIFRANLYADTAVVNVFIYVAQTHDGHDAVDAVDYRLFSENNVMNLKLYNKLVSESIPILFDAETNTLMLAKE